MQNVKKLTEIVRLKIKLFTYADAYKSGQKENIKTTLQKIFQLLEQNISIVENTVPKKTKVDFVSIGSVFIIRHIADSFKLNYSHILNSKQIRDLFNNYSAQYRERINALEEIPNCHNLQVKANLLSGSDAETILYYLEKESMAELKVQARENSFFPPDSISNTISYPLANFVQFLYSIRYVKNKSFKQQLMKRYNKLKKEFQEIEKNLGADFYNEAFKELNHLFTHYSREITSSIENDYTAESFPGFDIAIEKRDQIQALLILLNKKTKINEIKRKIAISDRKLKEPASEFIFRYKLSDSSYYPKSFWWHHLASLSK